MPEITLESFKDTLDVLIDANPHARNKGNEFKTWSKNNFGCDARISYIKEQRQITNRVSEQFRYFDPIVVFVCVSEVKRDTLVRYILERVYKQLENVAIIGANESTPGHYTYSFEKLITFKNTEFTTWATPFFSNVENASTLMEELGIANDAFNDFDIDYAWYVGTTGNDDNGEWKDFSDEYIESGIWVNGWDDRFIEVVNSIAVGDRIAIKSTFTQKKNLPFDNHGKTVGAMKIKAIGIVTENPQDGKNIKVDWERLDPVKVWFGPGTLRETIHRVNASDGYLKSQLLAFTFGDEDQDYSVCEDRYVDDTELDEGTDEGLDNSVKVETKIEESSRMSNGCNVLLYGVPGSGKSWTIEHEYCKKDSIVERLVFHPDYTNADFIGQILPVVDKDKQVSYEFTPGPFTSIMREAYWNPDKEYILIIEEINRGNAPAIFGEVFQLLDRKVTVTDGDDGFPIGTSEYGITNKNMAEEIYHDENHKVRIPSNLTILGTMNTSDQNVFTLDTAFQRRWKMRLIENSFDNVRISLSEAEILDTGVTWKHFCETINSLIVGNKVKMASAEDKRLGVYFIHESDLTFDAGAVPRIDYQYISDEYNELIQTEAHNSITDSQMQRLIAIREALMHNRVFPEKVIKYLWDDAFKFNPEIIFDTDNMDSLEKVIRTFVYSKGEERFKVFNKTVRDLLYS